MKPTNKNRLCRKCNEKIPYRTVIEGKQKMVNNRKFCLKCSPWGQKKHNPTEPNIRSNYRSSAKYREVVTLSLYKRALQRKADLITLCGGKCKNCGYDKCKRAMTFHHRDREVKSFGLTLNNLWSKSLESIIAESAKCDLLCMNCHAEVEDELTGKNIVDRVNEKYGTNF